MTLLEWLYNLLLVIIALRWWLVVAFILACLLFIWHEVLNAPKVGEDYEQPKTPQRKGGAGR